MKNLLNAILLSIALLNLLSCSSIKEGIIVEKQHIPPRTLYASGIYNQVGEKHLIIIEGKNENSETEKVKIYISKRSFDSLEIGDNYKIIERTN